MAEIPYGKIVRRTWDRTNFRGLTTDQKLILCYLWTGEQGETSPMIHQFSMAAAMETLNMVRTQFERGWQGLIEGGWFEYDPNARVIFFPKHLLFDPPQAANNVKGMLARAKHLDTPLLVKFVQAVKPYMEKFNVPLPEGWPTPSEPCIDGVTNPLRTPKPEPKPDNTLQPTAAAARRPERIKQPVDPKPEMRTTTDYWMECYSRTARDRGWAADRYHFTAKDGKLLADLLKKYDGPMIRSMMDQFFLSDDDWIESIGGFTVGIFYKRFNSLTQHAAVKRLESPSAVRYRELYALYMAESGNGPFDRSKFLDFCRTREADLETIEFIKQEIDSLQTEDVRR